MGMREVVHGHMPIASVWLRNASIATDFLIKSASSCADGTWASVSRVWLFCRVCDGYDFDVILPLCFRRSLATTRDDLLSIASSVGGISCVNMSVRNSRIHRTSRVVQISSMYFAEHELVTTVFIRHDCLAMAHFLRCTSWPIVERLVHWQLEKSASLSARRRSLHFVYISPWCRVYLMYLAIYFSWRQWRHAGLFYKFLSMETIYAWPGREESTR